MSGRTSYSSKEFSRISEAQRQLRRLTGADRGRSIYPVRLELRLGEGVSRELDPEHLLFKSVRIEPVLDPLFVLAMRAAGAQRTGPRSFRFYPVAAVLCDVVRTCPAEIVFGADSHQREVRKASARQANLAMRMKEIGGATLEEAVTSLSRANELVDRPQDGRYARCAFVISGKRGGGVLSGKVVTDPGGWLAKEGPIHRWPEKTVLRHGQVRPDEAIEIAHLAECEEIEIDDPDGIRQGLEDLVRRAVSAQPAPGLPGLCDVVAGQPEGAPVTRRRVSCLAGARIARKREAEGGIGRLARRVADAAAMAEAPPAIDAALLPPQQRVVGAHLATDYGFLNSSAVGSGKTRQAVRAHAFKARRIEGFRALVTCAKGLREQWAEEYAEHFPEASVLIPSRMRRFVHELVHFERQTGDRPGIVIASEDQVRAATDDLAALTYDEIDCDEAARLANPNTQLARALWLLRERAAVGVGLTATPVGRSREELDAIMSWCRDEREALRKRRMGRAYAGLDSLSRERLQLALGPTMQRVSRAELRDYMPDTSPPEHVRISPGDAQKRLLHAIEVRVAELYAEILERVEDAAKKGGAAARQIQAELLRQRGYLLSAVTTARMAKDPESLRFSRAVVAQMMEADGLLQAAIDEGSPSRQVVARSIAEAAADGEQVLCFSDFTSHLALIARELVDQHGLEPAQLTAATKDPERLKARFRAGEEAVVLVGPTGREGHNIQPASEQAVVIHYELPWEPRAFVQRTGRATRLGAGAKLIAILVPILRSSIEERVAKVLLPRAAAAVATLAQEGEEDPIASQLHGLATELGGEEGVSTFLQVCEAVLADHVGESAGAGREAAAALLGAGA